MRVLILSFLLLLLALPALAQPSPEQFPYQNTKDHGCRDYSMNYCIDTVCFQDDGNFVAGFVKNEGARGVVTLQRNYNLTDATAYACNIRWSNTGYTSSLANSAVLQDYGSGISVLIDESTPDIMFTGNLPYWWIACTGITGGTPLLAFTARVCPIQ